MCLDKLKVTETATNTQAILGTPDGPIGSMLLNDVISILGTSAEVTTYQSSAATTAYYNLRDWKEYSKASGAWAATGRNLTVLKGLFYFSPLNKSLYYSRATTDLILLNKI